MSEQMIEGQLDIYEVIELVEREKQDDDEDEPIMWHVVPWDGPFDKALCGAPMRGIDGGYTWNGEGVDCVVCADLAWGVGL